MAAKKKSKKKPMPKAWRLPEPVSRPESPAIIAPGEKGCEVVPKGKNHCLDVGSDTRLRPQKADTPPETGRAPYFAANLKNVCRVKKVADACLVPGTVDAAKPKKMKNVFGKNAATKEGKKARTEEQKRDVCQKAGGVFRGSFEVPLRLGKTELDFLSKAQAKALQSKAQAGGQTNIPVKPGPNLRLCFADKQPGVLVPVPSPQVAVQRRDEFKDCIAQGGTPKDCAIDIGRLVTGISAKQSPALGGRRSRRSRRR